MRRFEWMPGFDHTGLALPRRHSPLSAGYDLACAQDITLAPGALALVGTGLRVQLPEGEFLAVYARSSLAVKHRVMLANAVGVIDADYYDNVDNLGHILIALLNLGSSAVSIERGERVAQAVFTTFHVADDDRVIDARRSGGFGSTDQRV